MANTISSIGDNFFGVCYSSTHYGAGDSNPATTLQAYASDFQLFSSKGIQVVRSYMIPGNISDGIRYLDHWYAFVYAAHQNDLKVIIEIPVDPNNQGKGWDGVTPWNTYYIDLVMEAFLSNIKDDASSYTSYPLNTYPVTKAIYKSTVLGYLAGNENIPYGNADNSLADLQNKIETKSQDCGFDKPCSYSLKCDVMTGDPNTYKNRGKIIDSLKAGVPLFITCYPFEWGDNISIAKSAGKHSLKHYYDKIKGLYPGKTFDLALGETGWASFNPEAGGAYQTPPYTGTNSKTKNQYNPGTEAEPSLANEMTYLTLVKSNYASLGYTSALFFEAFDEPSKTGAHFQKYYGLWLGGATSSSSPTWKGDI